MIFRNDYIKSFKISYHSCQRDPQNVGTYQYVSLGSETTKVLRLILTQCSQWYRLFLGTINITIHIDAHTSHSRLALGEDCQVFLPLLGCWVFTQILNCGISLNELYQFNSRIKFSIYLIVYFLCANKSF